MKRHFVSVALTMPLLAAAVGFAGNGKGKGHGQDQGQGNGAGQGQTHQTPTQGPIQGPDANAPEILSLEGLRSRCEQLRGGLQAPSFVVEVDCSGYFTKWQQESNSYSLENHLLLTAEASGKAGQYNVAPTSLEGIAGSVSGECSIWNKVQVSANATTPLTLTNCEDIERHSIEALCRDKVLALCGSEGAIGAGQGQQQQQQASDCSVSVLETRNDCEHFGG